MSAIVSLAQPITSLSAADTTKIQKAQWCVGAAMGTCLGFWFLPLISGIACSAAELVLINKVLKVMECHTAEASDKVYWFFRQKTFFLFGATYIPFVGVPLQLFETYGLGQFAIHCLLRPELLTDEAWLERSWKEVEPDIFSGEHATQSYEQSTGSTFPDYAREKFIATVNAINKLYLASQKFPGAAKAQERLANGLHRAIDVVNGTGTIVGALMGRTFDNPMAPAEGGVTVLQQNPEEVALTAAKDAVCKLAYNSYVAKRKEQINAGASRPLPTPPAPDYVRTSESAYVYKNADPTPASFLPTVTNYVNAGRGAYYIAADPPSCSSAASPAKTSESSYFFGNTNTDDLEAETAQKRARIDADMASRAAERSKRRHPWQ